MTVLAQGAEYQKAIADGTTNILTDDIVVERRSVLRITVSLSAAVKFQMYVTDGSTPDTLDFNGGTVLTVDAVYTFVYGVRPGLTYNFRLSAAATVNDIQVDEVRGAVI